MDVRSSQRASGRADICDDRGVLARRMLLFFSIVLLAAALSSALTASTRDEADEAPTPLTRRTDPQDRVTATLPSSRPVKALVGDVVLLTVRAEDAERVEIRPLGVDAAVGPGLPATLLLVADRVGEFPVTLRYSGREIGTLTVRAR